MKAKLTDITYMQKLMDQYGRLVEVMEFDYPVSDEDITRIEHAFGRPVPGTDLEDTRTPAKYDSRTTFVTHEKSHYYRRECYKELVRHFRKMAEAGVPKVAMTEWRGTLSRSEVNSLQRWAELPTADSLLASGQIERMRASVGSLILRLQQRGKRGEADEVRRRAKELLLLCVDTSVPAEYPGDGKLNNIEALPEEFVQERRDVWADSVARLKEKIEHL